FLAPLPVRGPFDFGELFVPVTPVTPVTPPVMMTPEQVSKQQFLSSTPTIAWGRTSPTFANSMPALGIPATAPSRLLVTGADAGQPAVVRVFDYNTGSERFRIDAYPGFMGGVRVATGDVNGDGFEDVITAAGPGAGPHVKVFDGRSGVLISSFMAYSPGYLGGVQVAAGDVDGDGRAEIATA